MNKIENPEVSVPFIVKCPRCFEYIMIEQINCRIFRHAVYKSNGEQIHPHASKEECEKMVAENLVYGCAGPFLLDASGCAVICGYI